ncbi:TonB-dependent receptor [Maricaulis sp.]|uniref:TonB-dependent receptor n=1 Tax=Maricaulis sp. TaxID=1486257 RepID=UPI00261637B6|nr:TonB-dependent receptor [Maricaulis sp.]
MTKFNKAAVLGTTAILAGLIGASGALAQIDVITVTAQKREQTLQDTPVSVAAVTGEQIEQTQIRDAADLQTLIPSLRVAEFATSTNTEFNLRGIGTSSFNPGLEPSVGIFIDGVYRPRSGSAINDFLSVERVEVIRGPQSTLFGRNTPAGVVSIITQAPEYEPGYVADVTFGNYGMMQARGSFTGPIDDTMAFRLDATTHFNDGYIEAVDGREINNRNRQNFRGQLLWNPGDNTEIRIIGDYGTIDENCCAAPFAFYDPIDQAALVGLGGTAVPADPEGGDRIAIDGDLNTELTTQGISAEINHDFEHFTLTSITAYRNYNEDQRFDADFSDLDLVSLRNIRNEYDSFTQEFRITSTGDNFVDWMAGAFYYRNELNFENTTPYGSDARAFFDAASAPSVAPIVAGLGLPAGTGGVSLLEIFLNMNQAAGVGNFVPLPSGNAGLPTTPSEGFVATSHGLILEDYEYDTDAWSVFGQLDFHLTDQFTVTLGGRYSDESKNMETVIDQPDPLSAFSFVDLGQDLRLVSPGTCDPGLFPVVGGDACAFLVPSLLLGQGLTHYPDGTPINPAAPLPAIFAGTALNPLLGFTAFQNFPPVNAGNFPTSRNDTNFSGNIIFSYDVSDTLNVYASYATGFKPGGFNVSTNAAFTGVFEFEEETSESYEIGAKGSLFGNRFVYAVAYFDQTIEDFQTNNFVGNGFALENAGSIEVSGLEFEGQWAPTENLLFTGGFTYLFESVYGDYEFAPCPDRFGGVGVWDAGDPDYALCEIGNERTNDAGVTALFNDLTGRDRGNSELVGSLTATLTTPLSNGWEIDWRGEATYVSEFLHTTSQDPRPFAMQDAFTLFNASATIGSEDESWALQIWTRNLTDEDYTKGGFPSVGYLGTSYNAYPGDPQTYGVTFRVRG